MPLNKDGYRHCPALILDYTKHLQENCDCGQQTTISIHLNVLYKTVKVAQLCLTYVVNGH